jgi:hypothetical protein
MYGEFCFFRAARFFIRLFVFVYMFFKHFLPMPRPILLGVCSRLRISLVLLYQSGVLILPYGKYFGQMLDFRTFEGDSGFC